MRFFGLLVIVCLFSTPVLASYQPMPFLQEADDQYQCLVKGTGVIGPPYDYHFSFLVIYEAESSYLYFVFDYPLDPAQENELDSYQARFFLSWNIGRFQLHGQNWSVVAMPIAGEPKAMLELFLVHLRKQGFMSDIRPCIIEP